MSLEELSALKMLWKCKASLKILVFVWQAILKRVSLKDNLFKRHFFLLLQTKLVLYASINQN